MFEKWLPLLAAGAVSPDYRKLLAVIYEIKTVSRDPVGCLRSLQEDRTQKGPADDGSTWTAGGWAGSPMHFRHEEVGASNRSGMAPQEWRCLLRTMIACGTYPPLNFQFRFELL